MAIKYTKEMIEFLKNIASGKSYVEIAHKFNEKFSLNLRVTAIASTLKRYSIFTGTPGTQRRYQKGSIPHNKGKKFNAGGRAIETRFKKGNIPKNILPIGTETTDSDGYTRVKVGEPNIWKLKHRKIYEENFGEIPENHVVIFLDKNLKNFNIDNLALVSRRELVLLNHFRLLSEESKASKAGIKVAKIISKIAQLKKKRGEK